jgi:murein DD-endopeptidase MepM/ murein hydrolase activator NlpD
MYAHLDPDKILVSVGQRVNKGDIIATGLIPQVKTDKKTGAVILDNTHLHWEMRYFYDGSEIKQAPQYKQACATAPGPGYTYNTNDAVAHPDNFEGVIGKNKDGTLIYKTYHWTDPVQFVETH